MEPIVGLGKGDVGCAELILGGWVIGGGGGGLLNTVRVENERVPPSVRLRILRPPRGSSNAVE